MSVGTICRSCTEADALTKEPSIRTERNLIGVIMIVFFESVISKSHFLLNLEFGKRANKTRLKIFHDSLQSNSSRCFYQNCCIRDGMYF